MRLLVCLMAIFCGSHATAQDQFHLFYSNDSNAVPTLDRWRTVAGQATWVFERTPTRSFALSLGAEIISPEYLAAALPTQDRAFAGVFQIMAKDQRRIGSWDTTLGLGMSVTGPQTRLDHFLEWIHATFVGQPLGSTVIAGQVPDAVYIEAMAEAARNIDTSLGHVRPFVAAQTGTENLVRAGIDLFWPHAPGTQRMPVTGALLGGDQGAGWHFGAGYDVAYVTETFLIPDSAMVTVSPYRTRARVSVGYQVNQTRATFGLGWLSPEFDEQREGQFIGTVSLSFDY